MKVTYSRLFDIFLLIYFCALSGHNTGSFFDEMLIRISFFGIVVLSIFQNGKLTRIRIDNLAKGYGFFFLYAMLSCIWAQYNRADVFYYAFRMIQIQALLICVPMNVESEEDIEKVLKIVLFSLIYAGILLLIKTPINTWGTERFGGAIGIDSNALGVRTAIASLITLYFIEMKKPKVICIPVFGFFVTLALFSGSKKALIIILVGFIFFEFFGSTSAKIRTYVFRMLLIVIVVSIILYLIFNNPYFYEVIGKRVIRFIRSASGIYNANDVSYNERTYFISVAKSLFREYPVLGCGLNNFKSYVGMTGYSLVGYSHNNYWEILSCLGIVGACIYYSIHVGILYRLIKLIKKKKTPLRILFLVIMVILTVLDYAAVTYQNVFNFSIICVISLISRRKMSEA